MTSLSMGHKTNRYPLLSLIFKSIVCIENYSDLSALLLRNLGPICGKLHTTWVKKSQNDDLTYGQLHLQFYLSRAPGQSIFLPPHYTTRINQCGGYLISSIISMLGANWYLYLYNYEFEIILCWIIMRVLFSTVFTQFLRPSNWFDHLFFTEIIIF